MTKKVNHKQLMAAYRGELNKAQGLTLRIEKLFENAQRSKSGVTLADCGVLKELYKRLGHKVPSTRG